VVCLGVVILKMEKAKKGVQAAHQAAEAEGKSFDEQQHLLSTFNEEERAAIQSESSGGSESSSSEASSESSSTSGPSDDTPQQSIEGEQETLSKEPIELPAVPPVEQEVGGLLNAPSPPLPRGDAHGTSSSGPASGDPSVVGPAAVQASTSSEATTQTETELAIFSNLGNLPGQVLREDEVEGFLLSYLSDIVPSFQQIEPLSDELLIRNAPANIQEPTDEAPGDEHPAK